MESTEAVKSASRLTDALLQIDWEQVIQDTDASPGLTSRLDDAAGIVSMWAKQLVTIDRSNPALPFVYEFQASSHYSAALIALGLYRPAIFVARTMLESCLYYTYFRTHHEELDTLLRSNKYFVDKSSVIEYHKTHTRCFPSRAHELNTISNVNDWYREASVIAHGQVPGSKTLGGRSLKETSFDSTMAARSTEFFSNGASLLNHWILSTIPEKMWASVAMECRPRFLSGISKAKIANLDLG